MHITSQAVLTDRLKHRLVVRSFNHTHQTHPQLFTPNTDRVMFLFLATSARPLPWSKRKAMQRSKLDLGGCESGSGSGDELMSSGSSCNGSMSISSTSSSSAASALGDCSREQPVFGVQLGGFCISIAELICSSPSSSRALSCRLFEASAPRHEQNRVSNPPQSWCLAFFGSADNPWGATLEQHLICNYINTYKNTYTCHLFANTKSRKTKMHVGTTVCFTSWGICPSRSFVAHAFEIPWCLEKKKGPVLKRHK